MLWFFVNVIELNRIMIHPYWRISLPTKPQRYASYPSLSKDGHIAKQFLPSHMRFFAKAIVSQTRINSYEPLPRCSHCKRTASRDVRHCRLRNRQATVMASDTRWWQYEASLNKPRIACRHKLNPRVIFRSLQCLNRRDIVRLNFKIQNKLNCGNLENIWSLYWQSQLI